MEEPEGPELALFICLLDLCLSASLDGLLRTLLGTPLTQRASRTLERHTLSSLLSCQAQGLVWRYNL